jgi:hypothetical protein
MDETTPQEEAEAAFLDRLPALPVVGVVVPPGKHNTVVTEVSEAGGVTLAHRPPDGPEDDGRPSAAAVLAAYRGRPARGFLHSPANGGRDPSGQGPWWPRTHWYRWVLRPVLAIESDGSMIEAVNPRTGLRLVVPAEFMDSDHPLEREKLSPYDHLRRLIDAMEADRFLG